MRLLGNNRNKLFLFSRVVSELDFPWLQCKQCVISAYSYVVRGHHFLPPLAHYDAACLNVSPTKNFDAQKFWIRISPILSRSSCFFRSPSPEASLSCNVTWKEGLAYEETATEKKNVTTLTGHGQLRLRCTPEERNKRHRCRRPKPSSFCIISIGWHLRVVGGEWTGNIPICVSPGFTFVRFRGTHSRTCWYATPIQNRTHRPKYSTNRRIMERASNSVHPYEPDMLSVVLYHVCIEYQMHDPSRCSSFTTQYSILIYDEQVLCCCACLRRASWTIRCSSGLKWLK